jgi:hypothetical protein
MALSWHLAGEARRYFADTPDIAHDYGRNLAQVITNGNNGV